MRRRPLAALAALAMIATACGAGQGSNDQATDDSPVATVASTTSTLVSEETTVETSTATASNEATTTSTVSAAPEDEPAESLAMTADEITELEAELDAIDALLADLDTSFDED